MERKLPWPCAGGALDNRCAKDFLKSVSAEADRLVAAMLRLSRIHM